ncbi:hypothetical protein BDK51DRAFT_45338 [Blyttiomyces helicus]|uniref:Uncharacterized protein n=1 Tax=Blyttiomyces helicus TaxID=388810 RepID=A0A4P9WAM3_9FUNG|nr:hypothetical protein BDK51DRAFT_45338 [Blyttiomyces helicus]|eukprot:RKO89649.1 hypothetical protein BDK51DRAFT_45338 [Blyttiomyces helicus]
MSAIGSRTLPLPASGLAPHPLRSWIVPPGSRPVTSLERPRKLFSTYSARCKPVNSQAAVVKGDDNASRILANTPQPEPDRTEDLIRVKETSYH